MARRRRLGGWRTGVSDRRPIRIHAAIERFCIREEEDQPLHSLKPLPFDPETTVGPSEEEPLAFRFALRGESFRPPREEQVGHRTLDGPEQPTEARPLFWRQIALDDSRDVLVHREIARPPPVESIRIRTRREGGHEGVGKHAERVTLLR